MNKIEVIQTIKETGVVPVVRAASAEEAEAAIEAIRAGGIAILEITMTVPGAVRLIEQVVGRYGGEALIGAGTVLDAETARACISGGAQFIVSPALDLPTINCCRDLGVAMVPGVLTPTEIVAAWKAGADMVKVFPCGAMGGASYIKSLKAPLPQIELMPTGGISLETAAAFIKAGASALGIGADLVNIEAIRAGQPHVITERAKRFVQIVRDARANL